MTKFLLTICTLLVSLPAFAQQEWTKEELTAGIRIVEYTRHVAPGKQLMLNSPVYFNPECMARTL
jgi:hypothetical protein